MDQDIKTILAKLDAQNIEIAELKKSLKRIQQYFFWTFIITILLVVLPAVGLVFAISTFLDTFSQIQELGI